MTVDPNSLIPPDHRDRDETGTNDELDQIERDAVDDPQPGDERERGPRTAEG